MFSDQDRSFMKMALDEAQLSFNDNEVPVGAIIVKDNAVIGTGHNKVITTINVTSHAEINAIIDASKNTNNYRLNNAKMYVTLEPCHMCAKAIIDARIDEIIFAAPEPKTGSIISIDNIYETAGEVTYNWSGPNGFSSSNLSIENLQPGQYTFTVSDQYFSFDESLLENSIGISKIALKFPSHQFTIILLIVGLISILKILEGKNYRYLLIFSIYRCKKTKSNST